MCCYQAPDATNCSPVPAPLAAAEQRQQQRQRQRQRQLLLGAQRPRAERQLTPPGPPTHFLGARQNLCWRLLRGLSVGVGGARTNTAGRQCRQCVLSCASAYSRVRRGARKRETDNGEVGDNTRDLIGRDSIIYIYVIDLRDWYLTFFSLVV